MPIVLYHENVGIYLFQQLESPYDTQSYWDAHFNMSGFLYVCF